MTGLVEGLELLGEGEAHEVPTLLFVDVERRRRHGRDADLLGQHAAERHVVVAVAQRPEIGRDEVGALAVDHPEADLGQTGSEAVALGLELSGQGGGGQSVERQPSQLALRLA